MMPIRNGVAADPLRYQPIESGLRSRCLDQAAVDQVVHAGDVGGPVGGQERDQRGGVNVTAH